MELVCQKYIACTHFDLQDVRDLYAGFDEQHRFIVCLHSEHYGGYDDENFSRDECAIVSAEDAFKLAKKMGVHLTHISWKLYRLFGYEDEVWSVSEVMNSYYAALAYIKQQGIRYTIQKRNLLK
jgi:hypothetical protein